MTRAHADRLGRSLPTGPRVDLDQVGFVETPAWLRGDLLTAVALDLAPVLHGEVGLTDDAGATALLAGLRAVPWVRDAALQRLYPNRLRARVILRQPVARLAVGDLAIALDAEGVCLPCPPRSDLPEVEVERPTLGDIGEQHHDAAVCAAAAVAGEWMQQIAPKVPDAPPLRRVDATNLGYRADSTRLCEVRVGLGRAAGDVVWLEYDHPPGSQAPRVPATTKITVLQQLLASHPGLVGVARADLRFKHRWQAWIELAGARTAPP